MKSIGYGLLAGLALGVTACTATLSGAPKVPPRDVVIFDCGNTGQGDTKISFVDGQLFFMMVRVSPGDPWLDPGIQRCIGRFLQQEHDKARK